MITRYQDTLIDSIFSDQQKIHRWWEHTLDFVQRRVDTGAAPPEAAEQIRAVGPPDAAAVQEREYLTGHDVVAFLSVMDDRLLSPAKEHLHYGLTSSDLVDNAHFDALYMTTQIYRRYLKTLISTLGTRAHLLGHAPMMGRTHGRAAEPTDFVYRLRQFQVMVHRAEEDMTEARRHLMVRKIPGAVGTSSIYDGTVNSWQIPSTQVIPRDIQAEWANACIRAIQACEAIALEVRLLSRTGTDEVMEGGAIDRAGSSAMPHKRNPIQSEQICGLANVARGYLVPILSLTAMHHDRDLTNSAIERTVVPDLANLTGYIIRRTTQMIGELGIDTDRMQRNLEEAGFEPYSSLWVSLLQMDVGYIEAHDMVADAFRHEDPLHHLIDQIHERNLDAITFNRKLADRMDPKWMTRNV